MAIDLNPFDDGSLDYKDAIAAAALAAITRGAVRMPVSGVFRPIDFIKNRDLMKAVKTADFQRADVLDRARAVDDITRRVAGEDVAKRLVFPQNPMIRTTELGADKRPFDVYEIAKTGNTERWDTVPRDWTNATIFEAGQPATSQVAADIRRFDLGQIVKTLNKKGTPYRGIARDYTPDNLGGVSEELYNVMAANSQVPQLAALQRLRAEYAGGPLGQIQFVRDVRALAKPRKELRKEAKRMAREMDTAIETPAKAIAITTPKTDYAGTMSRLGRVKETYATGEKLPTKVVTNEGRKVKDRKENALIMRAVDALRGEPSILPLKTKSVAEGLAGGRTVAFDDADIIRMLGDAGISEATIAQVRANPVLINRLRDTLVNELEQGRIGDILGSMALTKDPFILQAMLRGRVK